MSAEDADALANRVGIVLTQSYKSIEENEMLEKAVLGLLALQRRCHCISVEKIYNRVGYGTGTMDVLSQMVMPRELPWVMSWFKAIHGSPTMMRHAGNMLISLNKRFPGSIDIPHLISQVDNFSYGNQMVELARVLGEMGVVEAGPILFKKICDDQWHDLEQDQQIILAEALANIYRVRGGMAEKDLLTLVGSNDYDVVGPMAKVVGEKRMRQAIPLLKNARQYFATAPDVDWALGEMGER